MQTIIPNNIDCTFQALVDQFKEPEPEVSERIGSFFLVLFPPIWELKRELGERYFSLGATASALELFQELESWENIIDCYRIMNKNKKAEELIRERLEQKPTPLLWCLLVSSFMQNINFYYLNNLKHRGM